MAKYKGSDSFLSFLRYLINPNTFIKERQELRAEMASSILHLREKLPAVPQQEPSDLHKSLLRHVLEKFRGEKLPLADLTSRDRECGQLIRRLINHILSREEVNVATQEEIHHLRRSRPNNLSPLSRLLTALQAMAINDFRRAKFVLPMHAVRLLPKGFFLIGCLVVADCWLLGERRARRVDELFRDSAQLSREDISFQLALKNALLGMELDEADINGSKVDMLRLTSNGEVALRERYLVMLSTARNLDSVAVQEEILPDLLVGSVLNNLVYAAATLSSPFPPNMVSGEASDVNVPPVNDDYIMWCFEQLRTFADNNPSILDTLGFFLIKKSLAIESRQGGLGRSQMLSLADKFLTQALLTIEAFQLEGRPHPREYRAVIAHKALLTSIVCNQQ